MGAVHYTFYTSMNMFANRPHSNPESSRFPPWDDEGTLVASKEGLLGEFFLFTLLFRG